MKSLALTFSSGWASGINTYLVVLVLGIAEDVAVLAVVAFAINNPDAAAV